MAESSIRLKLLIDTQARRVLFAEASKDCVDFLFYILSLPVSKIISLVGKQGMAGSMANLYESVENLNESYIQPNKTKDSLLKPAPPICGSSLSLLALEDQPTVKQLYTCSSGYQHLCVSDIPNVLCPSCRVIMNSRMQYVAPEPPTKESSVEGGFVKGVVTYMLMDNLVVNPMSTISSITLLKKFNVKELGALEEKVVNFGMTEAVNLLKASLETDKVLSTVFLMGKS